MPATIPGSITTSAFPSATNPTVDPTRSPAPFSDVSVTQDVELGHGSSSRPWVAASNQERERGQHGIGVRRGGRQEANVVRWNLGRTSEGSRRVIDNGVLPTLSPSPPTDRVFQIGDRRWRRQPAAAIRSSSACRTAGSARDRGQRLGGSAAHEGCSTVLTTYNAGTTCWLHTDSKYKHPLARS